MGNSSKKQKLLRSMDKLSWPFWALVGFLLIVLVAVLDFLTGDELGFSLFYLIPITLVTWFSGRRVGIAAALVSAITWHYTELAAGREFSHPAIIYWNSGIRVGFFLVVAGLLSGLKSALEGQKNLARVDQLTGLVNAGFFHYLVKRELDRSARYGHPLTLVYLDLDNFKWVNDQFGHGVGDRVLRRVADLSVGQLRVTDVVARLGGDEFALLLPETDSTAAMTLISKLQRVLLEGMQLEQWPVTFSIGVLTCLQPPDTVAAMINQADELMYSVKRSGRNNVRYEIYPNKVVASPLSSAAGQRTQA